MSSPSYHAVPQTPVAPVTVSFEDEDPEVELDDPIAFGSPSTVLDPTVKYVHYILGSAVLLPWNVLITAAPYFISRLAGSRLANTFSSYLSCAFTAVNFVVLAYATVTSKQSSPRRRINVSILSLSVLTALLTFSTFVHLSPSVFFAFVIINAIFQASLGSFLQTSAVAVASLFGPAALQALFTGQAIVAVIISGVQVASSAVSVWRDQDASAHDLKENQGKAEESSAFIFFGLSTVFLVFSAGAHAWLIRMPEYQSVAGRSKPVIGNTEEQEELVSRNRSHSYESDAARIWRVAKSNIAYEFAVAYCFLVTLAVFPPITISIQSTNPKAHPLLFNAIHFLVFNVGDLAGRYWCNFTRLQIWRVRRLLIISIARTLFIPLFLACNLQRSPTPTTSPLINSDFSFFLILLVFGLSNGYLSTMAMMSASSLDHNPQLAGRKDDVDVAATVTSFCIVAGLALGSVASFLVRGMVCKCNPFLE